MRSLVLEAAPVLFFVITIIVLALSVYTMNIYVLVFCILFAMAMWFIFRMPKRTTKVASDTVVSPVDGTLLAIKETENSYEFVFFIHELNPQIQWMPYPGEIEKIETVGTRTNVNWVKYDMYNVGNNQRVTTTITTSHGNIILEQIKSIGSYHHDIFPEVSDSLARSDHLGFIMFPARVDLTIPKPCRLLVHANQVLVGGETPIAQFE